MECRLFKNGNFHIRKTEDDERNLEFDIPSHNLAYLIYCQAFEDFMLEDEWESDSFCYQPQVILYNAKTQLFYRITEKEAENYFKGYSVILKGFEESQEFLEEHFYYYRDIDDYGFEEAM